jgi:glutamate synthase (NADPH/NADH) large chain
VLKVMSKMGISTVASYTGAQIFEADRSQPGRGRPSTSPAPRANSAASGSTRSPTEVALRHAWPTPRRISPAHRELEVGGEYQWRREGEPHLFDPETVFRCSTPPAPALRRVQAVHRKVDDQSERG